MIFNYASIMESIGKRIDAVRVERGLSKTEIWKAAKASSGMYSQWLGGSEPKGNALILIAKVLGVNPDWLATGKGDRDLIIKERDEYKRQIDFFYKNLSLDSREEILELAQRLFTKENPGISVGNPMPITPVQSKAKKNKHNLSNMLTDAETNENGKAKPNHKTY